MKLLRTISKSFLLSLLSFLAVAGIIYAATTIGTDILTTGTLSVTGLSTLGNATTTALTSTGNIWVNGFATTTATDGSFATQGTLGVTGVSTLTGNTILSTASSTGLVKVKQLKFAPAADSTLSGLAFGSCTFSGSVTINATSSAMATCATATGVVAGDTVFVQAINTLPDNFVIEAASSTTDAQIQVRLFNMATTTADSGTDATGIRTLNFWAVR